MLCSFDAALPISIAYNTVGTAAIPGDFTGNGKTDVCDFRELQSCFSGAGPDNLSDTCACFDRDCDDDVDLVNYATFRFQMTTP